MPYWVVFIGRNPGIYTTWKEAKAQVDGYPRNDHKRYHTFDEAQEALCKFHEDRYFGNDIESNQNQHQASVGASTSARPLEDQKPLEREANVRTLGMHAASVVLLHSSFILVAFLIFQSDYEKRLLLVVRYPSWQLPYLQQYFEPLLILPQEAPHLCRRMHMLIFQAAIRGSLSYEVI
ncbi:hypothetical protein Vadar_032748 [Vaccinium darrowii]|uniref:Uncharacterized protein n=1 Tax=Vaccinium darrowii TaxID=229202 RepID=A0ACB7Y4P4_9ERIC|nr:hypothetical protein Vadar_032748 [Vaccinium darrowii]